MRAEFSIAATAIALVMTTPAFAQTISGLDEITVTAQRREQAAQDVPVALTVVTGADLQVRGVTQVNGLEYIAPSFQVESQFGSGQPVYTIRGVGFRDYATNNSPTVGIYVDEVAYTAPVMTQGLLFDIERVEVLRGPQGTLYGRNTTGGAVNVISKRPTEEFEAGLLAEYGRFNRFQGEGYVSGALTDWARLRVSASGTQGGAWQVNRETGQELGDAERFAVRTLLEVDAGDRTELLFNVHYYQDKSDGLGLQLFDASVDSTGGFNPGLGGFQPHEGQRSTSFGASALFEDLTGIPAGTKPFRDNEGIGGSLTANIEFDALDLTYIGAYERFDRAEFLDYDAIPLGASGVFFESDLDVITQEVRLASNGDGPFSWLLGVYYANEELDENYQSDFAETFGLAVFTPYSQEVDTLSVFGQAEWQATDRLNLQLGLRYEDETRDLIGLGTFSPQIAGGVFNFANGSVDGTLEDRSVDLNEVSGKIGAEFDLTDDALLYATISRGVKSGGFTAYNTLNPAGVDPFEPETLWAYEAGFKSDLFDNTLRLNGAAFYYDYSNQQVQSALFSAAPPPGAVVGRIVNAEESEIYGAEIEAIWRPIPQLTITQAFGYTEAEFSEFNDLDAAATAADIAAAAAEGRDVVPVFIDRSGQNTGVPEITYSGAATYADTLYGDFGFNATVDYSYRDDVSIPLIGSNFDVESFWLLNARLGFGPQDGSWEIAGFGRNILNTDYDEVRNFFDPCCNVAAPGQVATYGVQVRLTY